MQSMLQFFLYSFSHKYLFGNLQILCKDKAEYHKILLATLLCNFFLQKIRTCWRTYKA